MLLYSANGGFSVPDKAKPTCPERFVLPASLRDIRELLNRAVSVRFPFLAAAAAGFSHSRSFWCHLRITLPHISTFFYSLACFVLFCASTSSSSAHLDWPEMATHPRYFPNRRQLCRAKKEMMHFYRRRRRRSRIRHGSALYQLVRRRWPRSVACRLSSFVNAHFFNELSPPPH